MRVLAVLAVLAFCVSACSTTPRLYSPVFDDSDGMDSDTARIVQDCSELVDAGVRTDFRETRAASAATGVAMGYGTGAVIFGSVAASESLAGLAAASSVAIWAMPVVGILAASGYSRHVRANREREIQDLMAICLSEYGYHVTDWRRMD
jgi:hypothetical protein